MPTDNNKEYKRLRGYLNPTIRGTNTDAVLNALATSSSHLVNNVEAVNDQLYITSASGKYLDALMADRDLTRPDNVGLSDEVFRNIGIEVVNRKQVRDLIHNILEIMYGNEYTNAWYRATEVEPYNLTDGETLRLKFDGQETVEVTFTANQFQNINAATAEEVADAIIKGLRKQGNQGHAFAKNDGIGTYVVIISATNGPSSSVAVLGGKAQNELKFPELRLTTAEPSTQWTFAVQPSGLIRLTWSAGPNPFLGRVKRGDYANIHGSAFSIPNRGTFTILEVRSGTVGNAYVEFENIEGVNQTTIQTDPEGLLFFNPKTALITQNRLFAAAFQTESRLLEIFIPATTRVVRRNIKGATYLKESGASPLNQLGTYIYDTNKPYIIGGEECSTTVVIDASTERIVQVDNAADFPDGEGNLIFGFGTSKEEGPVPYIAKPSSDVLLIDPSYNFKNTHEIGTNISLVSQNYAYDLKKDASDYAFYVTDVVSGRIYTQDLINLVKAVGIVVNIIVLYPNDVGLGKYGDFRNSERYYVWGKDATSTLFDENEINEII